MNRGTPNNRRSTGLGNQDVPVRNDGEHPQSSPSTQRAPKTVSRDAYKPGTIPHAWMNPVGQELSSMDYDEDDNAGRILGPIGKIGG